MTESQIESQKTKFVDQSMNSSRMLRVSSARYTLRRRLSAATTYRDIFIHDHSVATTAAFLACNEAKLPINHPTGSHILAAYSAQIHKHSTYNFNQLGEFSVNIAAFHPVVGGSTVGSSHSVLVWPDNIIISGLDKNDIPKIVNLFVDKDTLYNTDSALAIVKQNINPNSKISNLTDTLIISAISKQVTPSMAHAVIQKFQKNLQEQSVRNTKLYISSKFGGHRNQSTSVMILPFEDSFSVIHADSDLNIKNIIKKIKQ